VLLAAVLDKELALGLTRVPSEVAVACSCQILASFAAAAVGLQLDCLKASDFLDVVRRTLCGRQAVWVGRRLVWAGWIWCGSGGHLESEQQTVLGLRVGHKK
jgi:hypothetical protein